MQVFKNKYFLVPIILFIFAFLTHGSNIFHFPYYLDDEGIYVSQAWSFLALGKLSPTTYFYDHAPLGWIQIAIWAKLTGGLYTFGYPINSARFFILILNCFSTLFIYFIGKRIGKNSIAGITASLFFILSPLSIYYHRLVILDNIMVFWMLLSLYLLLGTKKQLTHYIISALCFGIAVLTKETAIIALPVYAYLIYFSSHTYHRLFSTMQWIILTSSFISLYGLFALLKGELFPYGTILGGNTPHVSLLEGIVWQAGRGGGNIFNSSSQFRESLDYWFKIDPFFLSFGFLSFILTTIEGIKKKTYYAITAITFFLLLYFIHGGVVLQFYIVAIIPFLCIHIGILIHTIYIHISSEKLRTSFSIASISCIIFYFCLYYISNPILFTQDQTSQQIAAVNSLQTLLNSSSIAVVDNYAYPALVHSSADTRRILSYWKIDKDPDIRQNILHNNWQRIDYILATPSVIFNAQNQELNSLQLVYSNSVTIQSFSNFDKWDISIQKVEKK